MGVAGQEGEHDEPQEEIDVAAELPDEGEQGEGEEGSESGEGTGDSADDEDVITLGSEEPPASEEAKAAPEWVKDLRRKYRDLAAENAKLKAGQAGGQPPQQGKPTLPPKPTMSDEGIEYDEEKFEQALDAWKSKQRDINAWEDNQRKAREAQEQAGKAVHDAYVAQTKALKVKDYQAAEDAVALVLDQIQQAILTKGAANAAQLVYALGSNPDSKELQELASIKDPVKFAVAVGKLETKVKVTKRTSTKPAPESTVRGSSGSGTATSDTLKRLQAEADKTGDRTKVARYLKQQRGAGK